MHKLLNIYKKYELTLKKKKTRIKNKYKIHDK